MKNIVKNIAVLALMGSTLLSCKDSFLEISDPNKISDQNYPVTASQIDNEMGGVYGYRSGSIFFMTFPMATFGQEHFAADGKTGVDWFALTQTNSLILHPGQPETWGIVPYNQFYENIKRSNSVLASIEKYRAKATTSELDYLNVLKGEALVNRAVDYYYAATHYSENLPHNGEFNDAMGLVLNTKLLNSPEEVKFTPRSTVKETFQLIVDDLKTGAQLLDKHQWPDNQPTRFTANGAKALLGKVYVILENWTEAKNVLKDVIDNSGAELLPFADYKAMWVDGNDKDNKEVLMSVNTPKGRIDTWSNGYIDIPRFLGPSYWIHTDTAWASQETPSWSMGFYSDKSIQRFGFNVPVYKLGKDPDANYINQSVTVRDNKSVDPRLWVNAYQMWVDSLQLDGKKVGVSYPREITLDYVGKYHVFSHRKYMDQNTFNSSEKLNVHSQVNFPIIRLAEIYLLYAETLIRGGGDQAEALEYINKVKRRAYDLPVNTASAVDYATLSSPTKAPASDKVLTNNPLRYERWAELQGESVWWIDIRRWRLGQDETDYYDKTAAGTSLVWSDFKYAWPIPTTDTAPTGGVVKQNPGY